MKKLVFLSVVAAGISFFVYKNIKERFFKIEEAAKSTVLSVDTIPIVTGTVNYSYSSTGIIKAKDTVEIKPELVNIDPKIKQIFFKEGEKVKKGDVLVLLDSGSLEIQISGIQLEYYENEVARNRKLFANKATSSKQMDEAEKNYKEAKSKLESLQHDLSKCTIKAPMDGYIGLMKWSVGSVIQKNDTILSLHDIDNLNIEFKVPEKFVPQIANGQELIVTSDHMPGLKMKAKVNASDIVVDAAHAITVKATLQNTDMILRPGMFVKVEIIFKTVEDAMLIPESMIISEKDDESVYIVKNVTNKDGEKIQIAEQVSVITGKRQKDEDGNSVIEIVGGDISPDDMIVVGKYDSMHSGTQISIRGNQDAEETDSEEAEGTESDAAVEGVEGGESTDSNESTEAKDDVSSSDDIKKSN